MSSKRATVWETPPPTPRTPAASAGAAAVAAPGNEHSTVLPHRQQGRRQARGDARSKSPFQWRPGSLGIISSSTGCIHGSNDSFGCLFAVNDQFTHYVTVIFFICYHLLIYIRSHSCWSTWVSNRGLQPPNQACQPVLLGPDLKKKKKRWSTNEAHTKPS